MSTLEQRREARRRKILENSESRLQKISSVQKRNGLCEIDGYRSSEVDNEYSEVRSESNTVTTASLFPDTFLSETSRLDRNDNVQIFHKIKWFGTHRTHTIVCIAFVINVLLKAFKGDDGDIVNRIFFPLLCFELLDLIFNYRQITGESTKFAIILRNIFPRQNHIEAIFRYLGLIKVIFRDILIYFFCFVFIWYFLDLVTTS